MNLATIQRQYDEVVAEHYDFDPQGVLGGSVDRAFAQVRRSGLLAADPLRVLDLGIGTGTFLARLVEAGGGQVAPFGLDISAQMIDRARARVPSLTAEVDDAANLDAHFPGQSFDLINTHFVTGFVPLGVLAPKVWGRLADGGCWSFVGGTLAGFPALRSWTGSKLVRAIGGGTVPAAGDVVTNPADAAEVVATLEANGFTVRECEVFEPPLNFPDYDRFMEFAHRGGWLTPFIEAAGLHRAGWLTRFLLNRAVFPMTDKHVIVVALAQKAD